MATPTCTIFVLPNEVLHNIAEYLDPCSLGQLVLTCRIFFDLFDRELHESVIRDSNSEPFPGKENWLYPRVFPPTGRDRTLSLRKLIDHGLDINRVLTIWGFTWLMGAVWMNNLSSMRVLLERGADVNAAESFGMTALHVSAHRLGVEEVTLLLQFGADPKATNKRGETPLGVARGESVIRFLNNLGELKKEL